MASLQRDTAIGFAITFLRVFRVIQSKGPFTLRDCETTSQTIALCQFSHNYSYLAMKTSKENFDCAIAQCEQAQMFAITTAIYGNRKRNL